MKKLAAVLLAILLIVQMVPLAAAEEPDTVAEISSAEETVEEVREEEPVFASEEGGDDLAAPENDDEDNTAIPEIDDDGEDVAAPVYNDGADVPGDDDAETLEVDDANASGDGTVLPEVPDDGDDVVTLDIPDDGDDPQADTDLDYVILDGCVLIYAYNGNESNYVVPSSIEGYPVTEIRDSAFSGNATLTEVTVPGTVTYVAYGAFSSCQSLRKVTFESGPADTVLGGGVFSACSSLTEVVLPANVTSIGENAFAYCTSLRRIVLPSGLTTLSKDLFKGCTALEEFVFPAGALTSGYTVFADCTSLTDIVIPAGAETVSPGMFMGCTGLKSVTIPASVTLITYMAFGDCTSLEDVYYNGTKSDWNSIEMHGENECLTQARLHTTDLVDETSGLLYEVKDGTVVINGYAGTDTALVIPEEIDGLPVRSVASLAFGYQADLTSVSFPDGDIVIGENAFIGCTGLKTVSNSESIISIGKGAFRACSGLTGFTIPSRITAIEQDLFAYCSGLKEIRIPANVKTIGLNAFAGCTSLQTATLPEGLTVIADRGFESCTALTSVNIPASVTEIGTFAFSGCTKLKAITIPATVKTFGGSVFSSSGLTSVTFEPGCTAVASWMFCSCENLQEIVLPEGMTTIADNALSFCSNLKTVTIPSTVTTIENDAFFHADSLTTVYYAGTQAEWNAISIGEGNDDLTGASIHFAEPAADGVVIDEENFPDEAFRNFVRNNYDTDGDGMLSQAEIDSVEWINVAGAGIASLQGIEHFSGLKALFCNGNALTELDLSGNPLLEELHCDNNSLTVLDVSMATGLYNLDCCSNRLTSLTVAGEALTYLRCYDNRLTTVDISRCPGMLAAITGDMTEYTDDGTGAVCRQYTDQGMHWFILDADTEIFDGDCHGNHAWSDPVYQWADDRSTVTASRVCAKCGASETETAEAEGEVTKEPSCETWGEKTWTASFENEAFETQHSSEDIRPLGHDYDFVNGRVDWSEDFNQMSVEFTCKRDPNHIWGGTTWPAHEVLSEPTCTESGSTRHTGIINVDGYEFKQIRLQEVPALGHEYFDSWTWADTSEAKLNMTCARCGHTITTPAEIIFYLGGTEQGSALFYDAEATYNGESFTDRKTVLLKMRSLKGGEEYTFSAPEGMDAYRWQVSTDDGASWTDTGNVQAEFRFTASVEMKGKIYRCVAVKDGAEIIPEATQTWVLAVVTQPTSQNVTDGEKATFDVFAEGIDVGYQWQVSKDGGSTWENCTGFTSDFMTYSFTATASCNGWQYRCVMTSYENTVVSDTVTLTVTAETAAPVITEQPAAQNVIEGERAAFTVVATGDDLSYQWQVNKTGTWNNCTSAGNNTATFSFNAKTSYNGWQYRCIVTNSAGSVISDAAKLTVTPAAPVITAQPADQNAAEGSRATFTVTASGSGLTYQWQVNKTGTWNNCTSSGNNTATFSFNAGAGLNGWQYRCVVTNAGGSVISDAATLTVQVPAPVITAQPSDQDVLDGDKAVFTVAATGSALTYQW